MKIKISDSELYGAVKRLFKKEKVSPKIDLKHYERDTEKIIESDILEFLKPMDSAGSIVGILIAFSVGFILLPFLIGLDLNFMTIVHILLEPFINIFFIMFSFMIIFKLLRG